MFAPDDRVALTEQLRPPSGFRLSHAVGTTFTLDLTSSLAVPLTFAGQHLRGSDDPIALLDAVRRASERIDVFAQVGEIRAPTNASDLIAFLEPMLHPVRSPRGGVFHPKVWIVEYERDESRLYRFICSSRNLTADRTWDAVVRIDGTAAANLDTSEPTQIGTSLEAFVRALPDLRVAPMPDGRRQRIDGLAGRLSTVTWERPDDFREVVVHALGLGRDPQPETFRGKRHFIVSPFITDGGVDRIAVGARERVRVVARPEWLDRLQPATLQRLETFVLDEAVRDPGEADFVGIHAKVFGLDRQDGSHVFVGSANATDGAFAGNVEVIVELVGPQPRVGVDAVIGPDAPLRSMVVEYTTQGGVAPDPDERADRALERAARALAASSVVVTAEPDGGVWRVHVRAELPAALLDEFEVSARLLTLPGHAAQATSSAFSMTYDSVALADISPFVQFSLTDSRGERRSTVALATLVGDPAGRRDAVIARQLDSPEKFLRLLFLMLALGGGDAVGFSEGNGPSAKGWEANASGVYERLALALAENPAGLADLDALVDRLRRSGSDDVIPPGFDELWNAVTEARAGLR